MLSSIIGNDPKYASIRSYYKNVTLDEIRAKGWHCLYEPFYEDPDFDYKVDRVFTALDDLVREHLLSVIPPPTGRCEEDHCYWSDIDMAIPLDDPRRKAKHYACLRWRCDKCIRYHKRKFVCSSCKTKMCRCHIRTEHGDEILCFGCDSYLIKMGVITAGSAPIEK